MMGPLRFHPTPLARQDPRASGVGWGAKELDVGSSLGESVRLAGFGDRRMGCAPPRRTGT